MSLNKNLYKIFIILLIAVFSLPVLISITYVVPATDDLCAGIKIEKLREQHTLIESAIIFAKDSFFNWQGTYFGTFVWGFQPNFHNNSFFALRAILMCSFSLFVCGTFLYIFVLSKKVLKFSTASSYAMAGIFTIISLNTTRGGEWFTWNTGCAVYQIPMICYLYSLIALIWYYLKRIYFLMIISIILSFFAAGGALVVTSLGCSMLLLTFVFIADKNKIFSKNNFILCFPFLMSVCGGILNSLAPGNYIRHLSHEKSGQLHIFRALRDSVLSFQDHVIFLNSFSIIFFLGVLFIVIYKMETIKITLKQFTLLIIFGCTSIVFVAFPFLLGYSTPRVGTTTRIAYTFDFAILFYLVVFTVAFACYTRNSEFVESLFCSFSKLKKLPSLILVLICITYFCSGIKNGYAYKTFKDLKHGYIQEATSSLSYVYSELSKGNNSDVVLRVKTFKTSTIYLPNIREDAKFWINTCTAMYFGAKSCSLKYEN